ncbi:MAG TPA: hypothetical protein VFS75_03285 [Candidatus Paceibacterota bacterium]|nr:hypothetical protein [Candidatus Paceibacterota bacterium]
MKTLKVIRITHAFQSFAPADIRAAWIGCRIPLHEEQVKAIVRLRALDENGAHLVLKEDAIRALEAMGRNDAAHYWRNQPMEVIAFPKSCCELAEEQDLSRP